MVYIRTGDVTAYRYALCRLAPAIGNIIAPFVIFCQTRMAGFTHCVLGLRKFFTVQSAHTQDVKGTVKSKLSTREAQCVRTERKKFVQTCPAVSEVRHAHRI